MISGLVFSGYHIFRGQRLREKAGSGAANHQIKFGKDGIELSSPVLGLAILFLSLAFLFLYLKFVYPITIVDLEAVAEAGAGQGS